jgi:hypothetical protein
MRRQHLGRIWRGIGRGLTAAAVLVPLLLLAACGAQPATPKLNEFGVPADTSGNMVLPVIVGLVVATALLVVAAYVVWRLGRAKDALPKPSRPDAWWTCATCGTLNTGDRDVCFSCQASRPPGPPSTPAGATRPPGTTPPAN